MTQINKTRSFKIPIEIENKINSKLVSDGYSLRGKSKWICDAIEKFLNDDEEFVLDCIEYANDLENLGKTVSFRPSVKIDEMLLDWVTKARRCMPNLEGPKSKIIRAAIIQALLSSSNKRVTR